MADVEAYVLSKITGTGGWVTDTNLFRGPMLAPQNNEAVIPVNSAWVTFTGGPEPINLGAGGPSAGPSECEYNVQILIRGDADVYGSTRSQAVVIWGLLHDKEDSPYYAMRCTTPAPIYLGQLDNRNHVFVINVRIRGVETYS